MFNHVVPPGGSLSFSTARRRLWQPAILCLLRVGLLAAISSAFPKRIPLGVLFDHDSALAQAAFRYEMERYNNGTSTPFKLSKYEKVVDVENSFELTKAVCTTMSKGIFALFSASERPIVHLQTGNTFGMPYVTSGPSVNSTALGHPTPLTLHVRPLYDRAMQSIIRYYRWRRIYYIYDSSDGLRRLQNLHALVNDNQPSVAIDAVRVSPSLDSFHASLRRIDTRDRSRTKNILLDLSTTSALKTVLRQIVNVGMHRSGFNYLLGTMEIESIDLSGFLYGGANVTGLQLIDRFDPATQSAQREWNKLPFYWRNFTRDGHDALLKMDAMLAMDSVSVATRGLAAVLAQNPDVFRNTFRRGDLYNAETRGLDCRLAPSATSMSWAHGPAIYSHLRAVELQGLTGHVAFDENGYRVNYTLDVVEMTFNSSPRKIGIWNSTDGAITVLHDLGDGRGRGGNTGNVTVRVTTILSAPFLMKKTESRVKLDGEAYEGFGIDMAHKLAEIVGFNFEIREVADGKYGSEENAGQWNGMIGELIRREADVAIAPLTITSARERVVDFTKPFMNLGISIMIKKPEKSKPGVLSFMEPLSAQIWMCLVVSYLGVSLTLSVVGRFSPYERQIDEDPDTDEPTVTTDFTLRNSLWFALGAFMQQGRDISPRSTSGRLAGSAWWFFTLIIVSTYTANLAAFLTIERMFVPIASAEELAKQTLIQYGTLKAGSTLGFFQTSKLPTYESMWHYMNTTPDVNVGKTEEGVDRVRSSKGKYAFLLESTMNEFYNQRKPCNTMRVGENLDSKGYGIAMPINSELSGPIGLAVLELTESGELARLQKKWWQDKGECVGDETKGSSQSALTLSNVSGIFYILVSGLGVALVVAFFEFLIHNMSANKSHKKVAES